jgi:hypothetical protein
MATAVSSDPPAPPPVPRGDCSTVHETMTTTAVAIVER